MSKLSIADFHHVEMLPLAGEAEGSTGRPNLRGRGQVRPPPGAV